MILKRERERERLSERKRQRKKEKTRFIYVNQISSVIFPKSLILKYIQDISMLSSIIILISMGSLGYFTVTI